MKLSTILLGSTLLTTAFASTAPPGAHTMADLLARAIDPATMDPTKLSVLSVLKTAMPATGTGTDIILPIGTAAPQWYKDLPADVMVLLAQMYPATPTAVAVSETAMSASASASSAQESMSASQNTLTGTLELAPTATKAANGSLATGGSTGTLNATLSTGQRSPTQSSLSMGSQNSVGMGRWSLAMGLGVATAFCFFA